MEVWRDLLQSGDWPAETDRFASLHLGVYFARAGQRVVVVFPDNRHCFLPECIICLWLPCLGLLCVHIATDATVHAASLLNWDVLPVLCLLSFPLRSWSTDRSTVPASNRHLAPPHHLQLNFIQKYLNSSSLRSCLQPDSTLLYLRYCISAAGEANEIKSALFSWEEER